VNPMVAWPIHLFDCCPISDGACCMLLVAEELAGHIIERAPDGIGWVYFMSGGSEAIEAALKMARQYFLETGEPERTRFIARRQSFHGNTLGALAAGFYVMGAMIFYAVSGSVELVKIGEVLIASDFANTSLLLIGVVFMIAALGFKLSMVPFHTWTPDVYEGAPTAITAFMSVGPKAAGFAVFGRVLFTGFPQFHDQWGILLSSLALLTMAIGNITALSQTSIKRMLAYSAVAHAGYSLLGVLSGTAEGMSATMTYLLTYGFMNMGAFAILVLLASPGNRRESLEDYKGLAKTNPMAAFLMLIFMFSLTGIPPTAGFIGKFYLLKAALGAGYTMTVIGLVVFSSISAFFYLRVVRYMYMSDPQENISLDFTPGISAVLGIALLGVLGIGLLPGSVIGQAATALLGQ